ncbi:MAG: HEAT repeat domain-containing protein [Promethearchaeota archaeon]
MEVIDLVFLIIYIVLFISTFSFGFVLVRRNLAEINRIEKEKFDLSDYGAMAGFGLMFALAIVFILNLVVELISPGNIFSVAGLILTVMLAILVIYPLWEVFFLGKPTSDSVHDFHKFLESKILDNFHGKVAYLVSFLIFIVIYMVPIVIIKYFLYTDIPIQYIAFMWFLIFPLFFLNYFSSIGQVSGIIQSTYRRSIPKEVYANSELGSTTKNQIMNVVSIIITWLPFLLSFYNFANPIIKSINGYEFSEKDALMGYISLATTVPFGIKGFFQKFWNKKAKTKTIDYVFGGYIFIGIAVNMLLSFVQINTTVVEGVLGSNPILGELRGVFQNYSILIPLIVVQSFITIVFGSIRLLQPNSDFHSDIRLQATSLAYGSFEIADIIKRAKTDKDIKSKSELAIEKDMAEKEAKKKGKRKNNSKEKKKKKIKHDKPTLYKSILLSPVYSSHGIDLNEQVRVKAAQYLFLIAIEDSKEAKYIVDFLFKVTIYPSKEDGAKVEYLSKESIDLLGEIGAIYPDLVVDRLIKAIPETDIKTQRYILDALGDIGEAKENLFLILESIKPLLSDPQTEVRTAAFQAITEMILEGQNQDKEFVNTILAVIYSILQEEYDNPEAIDSAFEALVQMSAKIADDLTLEKITPFLKYSEGEDQDLIDYVIQNAITVLSYMVYYNIDKFPLASVRSYLKDGKRAYIRYVAVDAVGNYILKGPDEAKEAILVDLMVMSLHDTDLDVVQMCAESVAEFLIMHKGYTPVIDNQKISILDFYTNALSSSDSKVAENASEALKMVAPLYDDVDIYPLLEPLLTGDNKELVRDCLNVIALSDREEHLSVNLDLLYDLSVNHDASIRDKAVYTLGMISDDRPEIDEKIVFRRLDDEDPQVRQEAIFALGKIGIQKPSEVTPELIQRYFDIDKESDKFISEVELYAESLGVIGSVHPSNEIIVCLQATLMGDTNPFAKDVIARALGMIGHGMIKSGSAIQRIENEAFLNQISWLQASKKKEYTIGNLIIILIEALQLKGIPNSVMNEISDAIQDLLPVFLFATYEGEDPTNNRTLEIIKTLLAQAYYANYNNEILETIDRIDSIISFKKYFEETNPLIKDQYLFYAKQYTSDGKQFFDQGEVFMLLVEDDPVYVDYALKSYEMSVELAPYEYFTPNCLLKMGDIFKSKQEFESAERMYADSLELFSSMDEVSEMKKVEKALSDVRALLNK